MKTNDQERIELAKALFDALSTEVYFGFNLRLVMAEGGRRHELRTLARLFADAKLTRGAVPPLVPGDRVRVTDELVAPEGLIDVEGAVVAMVDNGKRVEIDSADVGRVLVHPVALTKIGGAK